MKLTFTKCAGKFDLLEVYRDGSAPDRWQCPKQRIIPHDMVHYAVEHTLQARGFLGRVRDGEAAAYRMQAAAESDAVERLVEVFQGDAWSGGAGSAADLMDMYRVTCLARECPALALDAHAIEAVRATISDLTRQWQALPVGGTMQLELQPAAVPHPSVETAPRGRPGR